MDRFRSRERNVVSGTGEDLYKREIPYGSDQWAQTRPRPEIDPLVNDPQQAYVDAINSALQKVNSPAQVSHYGNYFQTDHNWDNSVDNFNILGTPEKRLGFTQSINNLNPAQPDYYGAGVDNLAPVLGDNYWNKEYKLPLGITANVEYDGDTLAGGLDIPSRQYYLAALANMLNK